MIRLDVKEYCHDCLAFDPDVEEPVAFYDCFNRVNVITDTIIRCKNRDICEHVRRHFEKASKGEAE